MFLLGICEVRAYSYLKITRTLTVKEAVMTAKKKVAGAVSTAERDRRKRRTMSQSDMLAYWTESRVLIPQRIIYVGSVTTDVQGNESGVDAAMVHKFESALRILEYFDKSGDITVYMTSFGGVYTHAMNLYDRIKRSACPITIEGSGAVMSSGIILMQAARTRILTRHARVMVHYPEHTLSGRHVDDLMRQIQDAKEYNEEMEHVFLKRMHEKRPDLTVEQFRERLRYDWTLNAQEAVSWGLADSVARSSNAQIPPQFVTKRKLAEESGTPT